jgi:type II secretory pathway pseudopilin PulG
VIILGIMVSGSVTSWSMKAKRDKEDDLLYDLAQYRDAMRRWYKLDNNRAAGSVQAPVPLLDLKDLLKDPKSSSPTKYLRRLYLDPITGKEFQVIKEASGRIVGVKSSSEAQPIKQANFPDEFIAFEGRTKYTEWEFNCFVAPPKKQTGGNQNLPQPDTPKP